MAKTNYFLAVDKGRATYNDKSDRYIALDVANLDTTIEKPNTIGGIINFTTAFENEQELMKYLLENQLINDRYYNKHICICYKSPGKNKSGIWKKCAKDNEIGVPYKDDLQYFEPVTLWKEILKLSIDNKAIYNYKQLPDNDPIKVNTRMLRELSEQVLRNPAYKYSYVSGEAAYLYNYATNVAYNNYFDNYYFGDNANNLVNGIYMKNKITIDPKTNEKIKTPVIQEKLFYEFVMFFIHLQRKYNLRQDVNNNDLQLVGDKYIDKTTGEIMLDKNVKVRTRTKDENRQMTIFDFLN